jgi:LuxR family maltose regulon positive regulatory protein
MNFRRSKRVAQLQLHWLGPPVIELDDHPLHLEMRKALALLAYLSLSPQYPTRDTLAALFWPEFDQRHALANLRRNLSSLAKQLPPGLLEADRDTIGLKMVSWLAVDVDAFREQVSFPNRHSHLPGVTCAECVAALEQAVVLYRGDFFQGFNLRDCPEFDRWQSFQQDRWRSTYAGALQQLSTYYQNQRQWEKAIGYVQSWLSLDRLNETAQRTLIHLYRQSAQPGLALRQYESWTNLLQDELGQAPDAETLALYETLLPARETGGAENRSSFSRSSSREPEALLKTKLYIPPLRVDRVARPRLFDLLDASSQRSLTLVSAPAGFGKTTLLASWTAHTQLPIAWLSIDEGDNDPVRFVAYLIAALDSVVWGNLRDQFEGFAQSLPASIQPTLIKLINHLAAEREPFVLILDDYQFIHSPVVHQALAFLVERIPACMRLVIATRSDPPLPLVLLRARDQLVEIRMSDLRFRLDESAGFLQQVMALDLSKEDISALEARTEGWIAGLQMAALALRTVASQPSRDLDAAGRGQAVSGYIRAFSGSNRYILDFLGDEVLSRHPEGVRRFLLQTSILERFSGSLCDAVTETEGSQDVIQALERENLFLVPLDSQRHWYRYHHLFSELLRFHLEQAISRRAEIGRERLPSLETLHRRAADWLEKEQLLAEAVQHWIATRQYDRAAALIEVQTYPMLLTTGEVYTLEGWLSALPEELYRSRPRLKIAKAWTLILRNQFAAASEQLAIPWQVVEGRRGAEAENVLGEIALVRGALAELSTRDFETMRTQGLIAWEKLPQGDARLRGLAAWLIGASYLFDGDVQPAEGYLSQAIRLCQAAGNTFFTSVAVLDLSNVRIEQGRHREAYHLLLQAVEKLSSQGGHAHPSLGYLHNAIGQILLTRNELDEAEQHLKVGIDLVAQGLPEEVLIMGISILPYLKLAQGKRAEAMRLAEDCLRRVEAYPVPYLPAMVRADLIRFWIRVGDRDRIEAWLRTNGLVLNGPIGRMREGEYTALAKALLGQGRTDEALKILTQMRDLAQSQGRKGKVFYLAALQALAHQQANEPDQALKALETSLKLAQPEGYIRPYVEEGQPMEALLQLGAARGAWKQAHVDGYVSQLLHAIRQDRALLAGVDTPADRAKDLGAPNQSN